MPYCSVYNCSNRSDRYLVKVFAVPNVLKGCPRTVEVTGRRRAAWLKAICRANLPKNSFVCGHHFHSGRPAYYMLENDPDWAPSLHLGHNNLSISASVCNRFERVVRRKTNRAGNDNLDSESCSSCQTELSMNDISLLEGKISHAVLYTEEYFVNDNGKVKTYTGLPNYELLMFVFDFVSEYHSHSKLSALSGFQEFVMTLMRLRLYLLEDDLAYRFNVSQPTVSRVINRWIPDLAKCLSVLIIWPDRETLRATMPQCFRDSFGTSVAVIIDAFEIFIERPSALLARAQTWSQYKHHNTVKFLIGICPQGTISFISRAWGGRTSDKFLTEGASCGLLDKLIPGDVVLADRGFDIGESVGSLQAHVIVPAFMHGRSQLSATDTRLTNEVARVRIHVERVIGLLRRKFRILSSVLDHSLIQPQQNENTARIDDIVLICCALYNLCPPIIPMENRPCSE